SPSGARASRRTPCCRATAPSGCGWAWAGARGWAARADGPAYGVAMLWRLLARGLVRAGIVTYVFSALALVANLVTGVVTARALGPGGRGGFVALGTVAQLTGFLFAMGVAQSLSYYIARNPQDGPSLLSSWIVMLIPLTAVAIGIGERLLPVIFSDDQSAIDLGRWFLLSIVLVVGLEL